MRLVRPFQIEEESAAAGEGKGPLLRNLDGGGDFRDGDDDGYVEM